MHEMQRLREVDWLGVEYGTYFPPDRIHWGKVKQWRRRLNCILNVEREGRGIRTDF